MHSPHAAGRSDPSHGGRTPDATGGACLNCGAPLLGEFCHVCGQAARSPLTSVRDFGTELLADIARFDSRGLRSLLFLLSRPGHLTREYLGGRRVRYAQPLQLYLLAVAAFFLVNAYRPFIAFDPENFRVTSTLNSTTASVEMDEETFARSAGGVSPELFGERFEATMVAYLPTLLVGLVLLFALLLMLLFRGSRRRYLEHTVFALHWTAFYLLVMIANRLVPGRFAEILPLRLGFTVFLLVYMVAAVRVVYASRPGAAAAKGFALLAGFQALLALWMLSAMGVATLILLR